MKKRLLTLCVSLLFFSLPTAAQEKPTPATKPEPQGRAVVAPPTDSAQRTSGQEGAGSSQSLPKFELQQFVITGAASIDLPSIEKIFPELPAIAPDLANPLDASRTYTIQFLSQQKEMFVPGVQTVRNGRLEGSVGTYLSSRAGLWMSAGDIDRFLLGDLQYGTSRAFVPFANKSSGHFHIAGGLTLVGTSEWYDRGILHADLGYGSKTHRFYGSRTPSVSRTTSVFDVSAGYGSPKGNAAEYAAELGLSVAGTDDSSSSVTESRFNVMGRYDFAFGSVPIDGRVGLALVSTTGSGEGTLPFFYAAVKTRRIWYGNLFVQGGGEVYVTQGMLGQKLSRIYPQGEIGFSLFQSTIASIAYQGHVQLNTLAGLLQTHPYIAATSTIRQSDVPIDLLAVVNTDWSEYLRTRLAARYQSFHDYPLFSEAGSRGFWTTVYLGTTNLSTIQADLFAKFAANSYFTLSLAANSSKNSVTGWKIPYVPDVQLTAGALLEVATRLRLFPTLSVVDRRVPDLYATDRMKAYLVVGMRADYSVLHSVDVFADIQNLTDANYDEWNGYRATPFVAAVGISIRW